MTKIFTPAGSGGVSPGGPRWHDAPQCPPATGRMVPDTRVQVRGHLRGPEAGHVGVPAHAG